MGKGRRKDKKCSCNVSHHNLDLCTMCCEKIQLNPRGILIRVKLKKSFTYSSISLTRSRMSLNFSAEAFPKFPSRVTEAFGDPKFELLRNPGSVSDNLLL